MKDFSRDELEVLASARRALGPSEQDAARVLHRATRAIDSGVVPAADAATVAKGAAGVLLAKKVVIWLAITAAAAWLGYDAGLRLGEQRAREGIAARPAVAVPTRPALERDPPPSSQRHAPALEPPVGDESKARAPEPTRRKPRPAPAPLLVPETDEAPVLAAPPPAPNAALDAEIKALRYVERALRNREPRNALARLAQLDGAVPAGQMMEERAAARAMARCEERALAGAVDQAVVMQRVLEFSQQYPASVYFARVRQTCLETIERDAATD